MGFFSWLKGAVNKLIGKTEIENALSKKISLSDEMTEHIALWTQMYQDNPPWKGVTVKTLNIPAVISSKVAKLVTIEAKCEITGSPRADFLANQIKPIWDNIRNITEFAAAKGGLMFKPYIDGERVAIDCIQADRFFPTSFDSNGNVTGGIFVAQKTIGKTIYTRLEQHQFDGENHTITNTAYRSETKGVLGTWCPLGSVPEWADIVPSIMIQYLDKPLFSYFKMPFANNIDDSSPVGVSIYSRAVETIEQLDRQYSRLIWEYEGGELAIHASENLLWRDQKGRTVLPEGKRRLYRKMELDTDSNSIFEVFAPAFRDVSILNGFNSLLRQIEQQCGLAFGTLSDPQSVDKTATEVIQSKQESYSTVSDIQKSLQIALEHLIESVNALADAGNLAPRGEYETAFTWDDSIIVDKESRRQMFWQYVLSGKFPMWKYLVEFEGYTKDDAKDFVTEANKELNLAQVPGLFS